MDGDVTDMEARRKGCAQAMEDYVTATESRGDGCTQEKGPWAYIRLVIIGTASN